MRKKTKKAAPFSGPKAALRSNIRNSAWILCSIGTLGLTFCVLIFNNTIQLPMESYAYTIFLGVMSTLFSFLLLQGLLSYFQVFGLTKESKAEQEEIDRLSLWFFDHYTATQIDEALGIFVQKEIPEDICLLRCCFIEEELQKQTSVLSHDCLDLLAEKIFQILFP